MHMYTNLYTQAYVYWGICGLAFRLFIPGFGEASPEAKAANNLHNFFTYIAVKIVTAQLEVPPTCFAFSHSIGLVLRKCSFLQISLNMGINIHIFDHLIWKWLLDRAEL